MLPARDPALARLERWIDEFLARRDSEPGLRPFAHWIVLRRARKTSDRAPLTVGHLSAAKTDLTSAAAFLDWLAEKDTPLNACRQADVDAWLASARPDRYRARPFVRWAITRKLVPAVDFPAARSTRPLRPISDDDPAQLALRLLHEPGIPARDRVAALLIVLFAQPVSPVARLTLDDVAIDRDTAKIRLGTTAIELPEPLAGHLRELRRQSPLRRRRRDPDRRRLLQGKAPGRPITEQNLSRRVKRLGVDCAAARRTALLGLAGELPPRSPPKCSACTSPRQPGGRRSPDDHGATTPPSEALERRPADRRGRLVGPAVAP